MAGSAYRLLQFLDGTEGVSGSVMTVLDWPEAAVHGIFLNQSVDFGIDGEVPWKAWIAAFVVSRDFGELFAPSHRHGATATCNMSS